MPFTKGGYLKNKEYKIKPKFPLPTVPKPLSVQMGDGIEIKPERKKRLGVVKSLMNIYKG